MASEEEVPFRQVRLPQVERIKQDDPVTYEALRALEEVVNQHGDRLNTVVGENKVVTVPPRDYQPQGPVYFSADDHIGSLPPPADTSDPAVPYPTNPRSSPIRMEVIRLSERNRQTRVVPPRGTVGQVYTITAPETAEFIDLPPSGAPIAFEPVQDGANPRLWTLPDPSPKSWVPESIRIYWEGQRLRTSLLVLSGPGNRTLTLDASVGISLGEFLEGEGIQA